MHAETQDEDRPDADGAEARARRDRRRLWRWLGAVGGVFLVVLGVIVYSDAPPPDLSDLAFEPVAVADADNLYLALVRRGEALKTAPIIGEEEKDAEEIARLAAEDAANSTGRGAREVLPPLRERLLNGDDWTPERLARWGPALDALGAELTTLLKLPAAQVSVLSPGPIYSRIGGIDDLMEQVRMAAWAQYRGGRQAEAVATALDGLEVGLGLADARGLLGEYQRALQIQGRFLDVLIDIAGQSDVRPETLMQIAAGWRERAPGRDDYAHVVRNEARYRSALLRALDADEVSIWLGRHFNPDVGPVWWIARTRVLFPLVYKPNLSIAQNADAVRAELASYDLPKAERPKRSADEFNGRIRANHLLRPTNVLGRFLVELEVNWYEEVAETRQLAFSRRGLVEAYVALRLYFLAHGTLPEALDELVPEYLAAVPVDYVDRQPIRYSREYRTLWSVGRKNLVVTMANQKIPEREVIAMLDFAAPAQVADKENGAR